MRNIAWSKENISHPWLIWQIIDNFTSLCYHYHYYYYYLLLLFFYVADVHEGSFIVFMVCSMIYMFFSCVLLKLTSSQPITTEVCNITLFITIRIVGWGGGLLVDVVLGTRWEKRGNWEVFYSSVIMISKSLTFICCWSSNYGVIFPIK